MFLLQLIPDKTTRILTLYKYYTTSCGVYTVLNTDNTTLQYIQGHTNHISKLFSHLTFSYKSLIISLTSLFSIEACTV